LAADHPGAAGGVAGLRILAGLVARRLVARLLVFAGKHVTRTRMQELSPPCQDAPPPAVGAAPRRPTRPVTVKWGEHQVVIGGAAPVVVQSMTNTDTADAIATAIQVKELAQAGSELVRITVNTPEAAREVIAI